VWIFSCRGSIRYGAAFGAAPLLKVSRFLPAIVSEPGILGDRFYFSPRAPTPPPRFESMRRVSLEAFLGMSF